MQLVYLKYGFLLFFLVCGREKKEYDNFYINLFEVDEVVKRVKEVVNNWLIGEWGQKKLFEIVVLFFYCYQVRL